RRARGEVVIEHAAPGRHALESRPVEDAAVEERPPGLEVRLEHEGHGARGVDRRDERAAVVDARAPPEEVEARDGQGRAALFEALHREQGLEAGAEELAAEEPGAGRRIPEVRALEGEE